MTYESSKEAAARLRAALKAEGYNARDVSIRVESYSMGSTIHATIRSAAVPEGTVREILESAERISRCEITHEILSGGNRFVELHHTPEVQAILARRHIDALGDALLRLERDVHTNALEPIAGTDPPALLGWENGPGLRSVVVWTDQGRQQAYYLPREEPQRSSGLQDLAFYLARLLDRKRAERERKTA